LEVKPLLQSAAAAEHASEASNSQRFAYLTTDHRQLTTFFDFYV
jgi:hypothetical protein